MKQKLNTRWCSVELDEAEPRKRFRRALMKAASEFARHQRCTASLLTPYWKCRFIDWLIYDCTLRPAGCICTEKTPEHCVFEVDASGCQTEGICLKATFDIPTKEFTKRQLADIVPGCGEYYPAKRRRYTDVYGKRHEGISFGPFRLVGPHKTVRYLRNLEWWYDGTYDETAPDGYHKKCEFDERND